MLFQDGWVQKAQVGSYLSHFPKTESKHNHTHHGVTPHRDDLGSWRKEAEKTDLTSLLWTAAILTGAWACWTRFFYQG